ncbi:hypothetical protein ACTFJW_02145 [Clostridium cagae]|uniref:hypothetical protein n=1 Tax=Clostridium cagae TaxID=2080751 RepID=UPI003F775509
MIGTIEGAMIISIFIYDWEDDDIVNEFDKISDENVELHKIICKNVKNLDYISDEDFY